MARINTGALVEGARPTSKKALKEALANGAHVEFDRTSAFESGTLTVAGIGADKIDVVGPDPYRNRKWYATVTVVNGKIKVA